jgi:hypothetical protein
MSAEKLTKVNFTSYKFSRLNTQHRIFYSRHDDPAAFHSIGVSIAKSSLYLGAMAPSMT